MSVALHAVVQDEQMIFLILDHIFNYIFCLTFNFLLFRFSVCHKYRTALPRALSEKRRETIFTKRLEEPQFSDLNMGGLILFFLLSLSKSKISLKRGESRRPLR